jgi:hypothetical protein
MSTDKEEEEMKTLKDAAFFATNIKEANAAVNALEAYGNRALPHLQYLVDSATDENVRQSAMQSIRRIKQGLI